MRKLTQLIFIWALAQTVVLADLQPWDYAFILTAQAVASPPSITIHWPQKPVAQIFVRRKLPSDQSWGQTVTLDGSATTYTDTAVVAGVAYEYEFQAIIETSPERRAYGYITAGAGLAQVDRRGKVLLVVDQSHASALAAELEQLRKDLIGDGWTVVRRDVSPNAPPPDVKNLIRAEYNADPSNMRSVFLFGHVAVPYSGLINPDMHPNHLGAWPADSYYADMDGTWTDSSVYKVGSEFEWNDNVPGDGKFDQSTIPGYVKLEVGRVDFYDMPSFAPRTERDLLRNYLNKDHQFRHRTLNAALRGLIRDNFGVLDDDAPAADAWRSFPNLFGSGNVVINDPFQFFPTLQNNSYLFAYACGGGDWEKADGVGTTLDFVNGDPKAAFYLLHGSYFGDWNTTDNFVRAAIATPTFGLVSIWSSLPHWYLHNMAMGDTIGSVVKLVQNNRSQVYRNSLDLSIGQVHISMMGDPTLRAFPLAPPANLRLSATDTLTLSWDPSWQSIDGYHVYWANSYDGPFARMNRRIITGTSFDMTLPTSGHYVYMVKAAAMQTTGSGSFDNLSQGIFIEYDSGAPAPPPVSTVSIAATDASGDENGNPIIYTFTRTAPTDATLSLGVQYGGTATAGQDYQAPSTIVFQPGATTATLTLNPIQDNINEWDETVTVTIQPSTNYNISTATASATIRGSGQCKITSVSNNAGFRFAATGFANHAYRIESRSPEGAVWATRANGTAAADGSISYFEASSAVSGAQLYRVVWE